MGEGNGQADTHDRRITGRHVLFGMLAFFGVVFMANGVMMWMAARTFDGVDEPDAYRRGVHYSERLAEARAQRALGWHVAVALPVAGPDARQRRLRVSMRDRHGRALGGLRLQVTMRSPVNAHEDRPVTPVADPAAPGVYVASVQLPRLGKWQVVVEAEDAAGHRWRGVFDLFVTAGRAKTAGDD